MEVKTICPHCSLLCEFRLKKERELEGVSFSGPLCPKGILAWKITYHRERLLRPLIRRRGRYRSVSWEEALKLLCDKIRTSRRNIVLIVSGTCTREEISALSSLSRALRTGIQTLDCLMYPALSKEPATLEELPSGDLFLMVGDPFEQFPVLAGELLRAKYERGVPLIYLSSRTGPTGWFSQHLQPRPGTELLLLLHLARMLIQREKYRKECEKIEGFEDFKKRLLSIQETTFKKTGVPSGVLETVVYSLSSSKNPFIVVTPSAECMGDTRAVLEALSNLALLTGARLLPLTGPPTWDLCEMGVEEYDGKRKKVALIFRADTEKVEADFKVLFTTFFAEGSDLLLPLPAFTEMNGTYFSWNREVKFSQVSEVLGETRGVDWIVQQIAERVKVPLEAVKRKPPIAKRKFAEVVAKSFEPTVNRRFPYVVCSQPTYFNQEWRALDGGARFFEIGEEDAKKLGLREGFTARIKTETEELQRVTRILTSVPPGVIYVPDFKLCRASVEAV